MSLPENTHMQPHSKGMNVFTEALTESAHKVTGRVKDLKASRQSKQMPEDLRLKATKSSDKPTNYNSTLTLKTPHHTRLQRQLSG